MPTDPSPGQAEYSDDLPQKLYLYFRGASQNGELPSLDKFAVLQGFTLSDLKSFCRNEAFDRAVRECSEIRRDYLIDTALNKRADASFVKFLLAAEYGMGEKEKEEDDGLSVTLTVVK